MVEAGAGMRDEGRDIAGDISPIRAILFDKDGTLVDFERTWGPAVEVVLHQLAHGDERLYRNLAAASGFVDGARRFLPDSPLIDQPTGAFAVPWAKLLGQPADTAFLAQIDRMLCEATTGHLAAIGDPKTAFGELAARGYRLGVITNDAEASARAHMHGLGVEHLLDFIAGYDSGFGAKPEPAAVLAFAVTVGVATRDIAVVGDTCIDVAMARAAGAFAIMVQTGPATADPRDIGADVVIASIAELATWLDKRQPPTSAVREH
jgi:phosphoglycolate phosphatase